MNNLIKIASLELQASILADMWEEELVKEATPPDTIPPEQMSRPPLGEKYTAPFMQRAFTDRLQPYTDAPRIEAPVGTQTAEEETQRRAGEALARTPAYASMAAQQLRNRSGALSARASERSGDFAGDPKYHEELNRYLRHGRDVSELEAALQEDAPGVAPGDQIPPLENGYIREPSNHIYDAAENARVGVDT